MIKFFKDRILELLHKDTLDSYRVKVNNSNSLLYELFQLLADWKRGNIKRFETVQYSCAELLSSLNEDECFSYGNFNKDFVKEELKELASTKEKTYNCDYIQYLIHQLINLNKETYLEYLFLRISIGLNENSTQENFIWFDRLLNSFVAELIRIGYSKSFLYIITKNAFSNESRFTESFAKYRHRLLEKKNELFHVFFKLVFDRRESIPNHHSLIDSVPQQLITEKARMTTSAFFENDEKIKYLHFEENVLDADTALAVAKLKLSSFLDKLHLTLGLSQVEVYKLTYITTEENSKGRCKITDFIVDGTYSQTISFDEINNKIENIFENKIISNDVKDRFNCAIRHFRLGNCARDLEQKFINYWIGLEYIFSVPEKDISTFGRIKDNLPIILSCGYMKRNFIYIEHQIQEIKKDLGLATVNLWDADMASMDLLIAHSSTSLIKYRLSTIKSLIIGNSDKREIYIKKHKDHLLWHIERLYRLRNELIHDAAIKNNIVQVTSNLRYYLTYTLNQMTLYFNNLKTDEIKKSHTIDDFFYEYRILYNNIKKHYEKNAIFSIDIELNAIL